MLKVIKNTINTEQRGRVLSWKKHQKVDAQDELAAAIHGARNLPENQVGSVHSFQDILTVELDGFIPGSTYFRRSAREQKPLRNPNESKNKMTQCKLNTIFFHAYILTSIKCVCVCLILCVTGD